MKASITINNEKGIILVTTLMFLLILTVLGATAYLLSTTDVIISGNYKHAEEAFYNAEAGVEFAEALIEAHLRSEAYLPGTSDYLPVYGSPEKIPGSDKIPAGFSFTLSPMEKVGTNLYQFTSTGNTFGGGTGKIEVELRRKSVYDYAIFADKKITFKSSACVFSYNSGHYGWPVPGDGTWDINDMDDADNDGVSDDDRAYSTGQATIGSNGDGSADDKSFEFNKGVFVDGTVKKGQKGVSGDKAEVWPCEEEVLSDHQISGTIDDLNYEEQVDPENMSNDHDFNNNFSDYAASIDNDNGNDDPGGLVSGNLKELDENPSIEKNDGDITLRGKPGGASYYFDDPGINLQGQSLTIDAAAGPVDIWIVGALRSNNGGEIFIRNTSDVNTITFNIKEPIGGLFGSVVRLNNNADFNPGGVPSHVLIRTDSDNNIQIENGGNCNAVIYAPFASVQCNDGGHFFGAIRADRVELKAGMKMYYDEALKNGCLTDEIEFISWRQVLR